MSLLNRRRSLALTLTVLGIGAGFVLAAPAAALNALSALGSRRVADGLRYGPLPRQQFDLYLPASERTAGQAAGPENGWPLVVFFYGGAWRRGERADYRFVGEALAARGIAAMVVDYRLHPQVRYPDFLRDCAAAVAHALTAARGWGADPRRVLLMGHSAGAYNAAMLALDARWLAEQGRTPAALAGWIGLAGPYDFLPIRTPEVRPVFDHPNVLVDSQPLHHAARSVAPALLLAASEDVQVNPQRSTVQLAARLAAAGTPVRHLLFDGVDHASVLAALAWPLRRLAPVLAEIESFVRATPPVAVPLA